MISDGTELQKGNQRLSLRFPRFPALGDVMRWAGDDDTGDAGHGERLAWPKEG